MGSVARTADSFRANTVPGSTETSVSRGGSELEGVHFLDQLQPVPPDFGLGRRLRSKSTSGRMLRVLWTPRNAVGNAGAIGREALFFGIDAPSLFRPQRNADFARLNAFDYQFAWNTTQILGRRPAIKSRSRCTTKFQ